MTWVSWLVCFHLCWNLNVSFESCWLIFNHLDMISHSIALLFEKLDHNLLNWTKWLIFSLVLYLNMTLFDFSHKVCWFDCLHLDLTRGFTSWYFCRFWNWNFHLFHGRYITTKSLNSRWNYLKNWSTHFWDLCWEGSSRIIFQKIIQVSKTQTMQQFTHILA
jgi:hypothetical protein